MRNEPQIFIKSIGLMLGFNLVFYLHAYHGTKLETEVHLIDF